MNKNIIKGVFITKLLILLFFISSLSHSNEPIVIQSQGQGLANQVSSSIATPMFEVDEDAMKNVLSLIVLGNTLINAVIVQDLIVNETLVSIQNVDGKLVFNQPIPNNILSSTSYKSHVIVEDEKIGQVTLYYDEDETQPTVALTGEEKAWLEKHPVIRIGTDAAFPPFEFYDENKNYIGSYSVSS